MKIFYTNYNNDLLKVAQDLINNVQYNLENNNTNYDSDYYINIEYAIEWAKKIEDFKNGMAKISDVINAIGVDLLDCDIEDLEKMIKEYKEQNNE